MSDTRDKVVIAAGEYFASNDESYTRNQRLKRAAKARAILINEVVPEIESLTTQRDQLQARIAEYEGEDGPGYWMGLVDAARGQRDKYKAQRDQLAEALEALGDEDWWGTETMLSASDFARRQLKRIMPDKGD